MEEIHLEKLNIVWVHVMLMLIALINFRTVKTSF